MDDELGLVRRLFIRVDGVEVEVTTEPQELSARVLLVHGSVAEAPIFFYEGNERIMIGRSVFASRHGRVF